ncbi:hypothetical protein EIO_2233 [Ketogulonicigenium vulgare Y25]|nr:hypothetical protein EIO_2233 [Ketogulonicigenium vulgare Y25]
MRRIALALAIGMASGASAQQVIAPSGVEVQLYDVRFDEDAARFRFVAPVLAGVAEVPDSWTADATWLCTRPRRCDLALHLSGAAGAVGK